MAHVVRPPQQNRSAARPVGDAVDSELVVQIRLAFRNASRSQIKALRLIDIVCAYRTALEDGYAPTTIEIIDLGDDDQVSEDKESSDDDEGPQGPSSKLEQCEHDLNYIVAHAMIYLSRTARKAREIKRVIDWKEFTALVNENSSKRDFQIPYSIIRAWTRLIEGVYYDLIHKDLGLFAMRTEWMPSLTDHRTAEVAANDGVGMKEGWQSGRYGLSCGLLAFAIYDVCVDDYVPARDSITQGL